MGEKRKKKIWLKRDSDKKHKKKTKTKKNDDDDDDDDIREGILFLIKISAYVNVWGFYHGQLVKKRGRRMNHLSRIF